MAGVRLGSHAIKILGWGVDDGTPYWYTTKFTLSIVMENTMINTMKYCLFRLVANSWNCDWGDKGDLQSVTKNRTAYFIMNSQKLLCT